MRILVTGVSGYVGAALVPRLQDAGHEVRGFARVARAGPRRRRPLDDLVIGDAVERRRARPRARRRRRRLLPDPLDGGPGRSAFPEHERRAAERFADRRARGRRAADRLPRRARAARRRDASRHLASRLAVEEALLEAADEPIALRASIVIGARSRSFRFLVRLIERLPVLALPAWRAQPHAADRRPRRARLPRPRRRRARRARRALVGHRRPGGDDLRAADRADRRRDARRSAPRSGSASTSRRSPRSSPRRSPARTRGSSRR